MKLTVGLDVFHEGVPYKLLHMLHKTTNGELWRVQPLFVEASPTDEFIKKSDRVTLLHSQGNR